MPRPEVILPRKDQEPLPQKTAFLFSGQGISPPEIIACAGILHLQADDVLAYHLGLAQKALDLVIGKDAYSLNTDLWNPSSRSYRDTAFVQLVTHALNIASYQTSQEKVDVPAVVAGHSVGEVAALVAAGVLDEWESYVFVAYRGLLMQKRCDEVPSTLFSIEGLSEEEVIAAGKNAKRQFPQAPSIGLFNAPGIYGVGGRKDQLAVFKREVQERGGMATDMQTAGAFHTPIFDKARRQMVAIVGKRGFLISDPQIPVVANRSGEQLNSGLLLLDQHIEGISSPVLWTTTLDRMREMGINRFVAFGPGYRVLPALNRRNGIDRRESVGFNQL